MTAVKKKPAKLLLSKFKKYTGDLAEPIYEPIILGILGDLGGHLTSEAKRRAVERQGLKFKALFEWHAIDLNSPDLWRSLAIALALAHVPGLQVVHEPKPRRGRKRSWKAGLGIDLVRDVEAVQAQKKLDYDKAIALLRKSKNGPWCRYSHANLVTRHREARKIEQRRRLLARELISSSPSASQVMGGLFGVGPLQAQTDEKPS